MRAPTWRRYHAYGRDIHTQIPLPELGPAAPAAPAPDGEPDALRIAPARPLSDEGWAWTPRTDSWLQVARRPDAIRVRLANAVDFLVSPDATHVRVCGGAAVDAGTVRHLLLDQLLPILLSHSGVPLLHASAVAFGDAAVAFVGPTGRGKSTLAACLGRHGAAVLADDALALERRSDGWWASPSYPSVRVWPDVLDVVGADRRAGLVAEYSDKRRLDPSHRITFGASPVPLRRVYLLTEGSTSAPVVATPSLRAAVVDLLAQTFVLDTADGARLAAQLEWVCQLAADTPVRTLSYGRAPETPALAARAIRDDLVH